VALTIVEKAALTDVGRQRQSNEDSYLERSPLFAVADGMGGARAGEVASRLAVEAFEAQENPSGSPEQQLAEVARAANRQIHRMSREDSDHAGMGTTLTAALVSDREVAIGHVGDSRLYRFRDGELERLTQDHSLVEEFVRQGKLTPEEAAVHPQRSIITRALGPEPEVEVETYTHQGRAGDVYLICSDGLTGMVSEADLAEILKRGESLEQAAKEMIDAANENGGKDNITVVLFRLGDGDGDAVESDTMSGQATSISADEVRAAATTAPPASAQLDEDTMALSAAEAAEARAAAEPAAPVAEPPVRAEPLEPQDREPRPLARRRGPAPRSRAKKILLALLGLLALGALVFGFLAFNSSVYFVGTDDNARVTVFKGLPYELPFGIELYRKDLVSQVPATAITDKRRRDRVLDHQLRSRGDATDLVRQLERDQP
jgi:protein phosphatase